MTGKVRYTVSGSEKPRPEDYAVDDLFHLERSMCRNCGLVFDYRFEPGDEDLPGHGWPLYEAEEDQLQEDGIPRPISYRLSCPRCATDLDQNPPIPIRVAEITELSDFSDQIQAGEGPTTEFKKTFPKNAGDVRKTIAAFANTAGGRIFFGINDDGMVTGLNDVDTPKGKEQFHSRILGLLPAVSPRVQVRVDFLPDDTGLTVAVVTVPRGRRRVHAIDGTVYVRDLAESRPATAEEIETLARR